MRPYFDNSKQSKLVAFDTAEQLLTDLIEPGSDIKIILYNAHLRIWVVKFKHGGDDMEFDDFHELYKWLITEDIICKKDSRFPFTMPKSEQLIEIAILFNEGKIEKEKLSDMISMCQFILDRLYQNRDISKPSSKEKY